MSYEELRQILTTRELILGSSSGWPWFDFFNSKKGERK